jgi:peptidoglycan/LPS O-acetylase OafA/YrhL
MGHLPFLDGLRTVAVFSVMLFHAEWLECGWVGVQAFFVLSGFLITRILVQTKERVLSDASIIAPSRRAREFFGRFYWRRSLRIFPLYFAFILVMWGLLAWTGQATIFRADLPWLLTYSLNFARVLPGYQDAATHSHLWSLAVEEQFYLLWPAAVWLLSASSLRRLTVAAIVGAPLARLLAAVCVAGFRPEITASLLGEAVYSLPTSHLDAFGCGAAIALGIAWFTESAGRKLGISALVTLIAGLGSVLVLRTWKVAGWSSVGYPHGLGWLYGYVWGYSLLNLTFAFLIALLVAPNRSSAPRPIYSWLAAPPIAYLGTISYGLYLWHSPILGLAARVFKVAPYRAFPVAGLAASAALTIVVAMVSYHFFESWFLKLKDGRPAFRGLVGAKTPLPGLCRPAAASEETPEVSGA